MNLLGIVPVITRVQKATRAAISTCYNCVSSGEDSSWEVARVITELRSLGDVLKILERHARQAESSYPVTDTRLPVLNFLCEPQTGPLAMYKVELDDLKQKLAHSNKHKKNGLIKARDWPMNREDINRTLKIIQRFKSTLELAVAGSLV